MEIYKEAEILPMQKEESTALTLTAQLCKTLDTEGILYCHWKSNSELNRSASGEKDLDLLIRRSDITRFQEVLFRLGFKECLAKKIKELPGVQSFLGYDQQTDKYIHLHAHYQLIFGHLLSKNYHLPIERPYLESARQNGLFRIPAPEFELVVFVIRMIIKHSTWETILNHEGNLSKSERQELVYLERKADPAKIIEVLKLHLPFIEVELFNDCIRALKPGCSPMRRIRTGWQLQNRLKVFARRSQSKDLLLRFWRKYSLIFQWVVLKKQPKFQLADGGAVVAIIGGDGAGKTTAIEELHSWLSHHLDTRRTHLGKPQWSKTTIAVRGILKIGTILHLYRFVKAPIKYGEDENDFEFPGIPWLIRQVCTARDRLLTYKQALRYASNGSIVICDRYPIQQIRFMESPSASKRMTSQVRNNKLVRLLINLEARYYQQILLPDLLIVLRLEPEIAVQRKPKESEFSVRTRNNEIWEFDWKGTPAHIVDASQPKEVVLSEIKYLVWSKL